MDVHVCGGNFRYAVKLQVNEGERLTQKFIVRYCIVSKKFKKTDFVSEGKF